jgi:hypothetical protein
LGVIAIAAVLAAILFPSFGLAREAAARADSPSGLATVMDASVAAYDSLQCALQSYAGEGLALGGRDRAGCPVLEPAAAPKAQRAGFRVYLDGHIQNVALGGAGFLTRDTSDPTSVRVLFAPANLDDPNQVWNFKKGPDLPDHGRHGMHRYTLVAAPISPGAGSVSLLTALGPGGPIIMRKQRLLIRAAELAQIPLGQRWDFLPADSFHSQSAIAARAGGVLQPDGGGLLLIAGRIRTAATCDLTPKATAGRKRRLFAGQTCSVNYGHVPDCCDATWKNPACGGNPSYWESCSPRPAVAGQNQNCQHSQ